MDHSSNDTPGGARVSPDGNPVRGERQRRMLKSGAENRRRVLKSGGALAAGALTAGLLPAIARSDQTTRLVVGFPPSGLLDMAARILSKPLGEQLDRTVIVDNRPGAGSLLAAQYVARMRGDGDTLLLAPIVVPAFFPALYSKLGFDPLEDLVPVAMLGRFSFVLVIGAKVPANNLSEFVAYVKANPGKVSYGSLSAGTPSHFLGEMFNRAAGTDMLHVPYGGGAPVMTALRSGEIQAAFIVSGDSVQQAKAGHLKVLGITGRQRSPLLPGVPPLSEQMPALTEMDRASLWYGFFCPKGIDTAAIAKTNQAIVASLKQPQVAEQLAPLDLRLEYPNAAEFAGIVRRDSDYWGKFIRSTGFKLE